MSNQITATYHRYGYSVDLNGTEIYSAGNSHVDSQMCVPLDHNHAVSLRKLRSFAIQTGRELAKKHKAQFAGIERRNEADDY